MFSKILMPLDGSDPSNNALTYAIEQASTFNAELVILTVIKPTSTLIYGDDDYPTIDIDDYEKAMEESHKQVLIQAEQKVKMVTSPHRS